MYGAIKQAGYNEQFAIGTIATSGTLGIHLHLLYLLFMG